MTADIIDTLNLKCEAIAEQLVALRAAQNEQSDEGNAAKLDEADRALNDLHGIVTDLVPMIYRIIRFCFDELHPDHRRVIETGLTLEEAQAHCNDESTHGKDADGNPWFDGYEEEL